MFAYDKSARRQNQVVFHQNTTIIDYGGEYITAEELHKRYYNFTAPYTAELKRNVYQDCGCDRSIGSLANTAPTTNQNNAILVANYRSHPQKVVLQATRPIRDGEEIFVDYGDSYHLNENTHHRTKYIQR